MLIRSDGRNQDAIREVRITKDYIKHAEGSVLIELGETKVICTATVDEKVPTFLKGLEKGWVTAEYSMLPRATKERTLREAARGKQSGRTQEIQRLIGRSLRSVVDLEILGERTILLDCDVIQADGGTRTASITGAFVAMVEAMGKLKEQELIPRIPVRDFLAAISVGKINDAILLDLSFEEDSHAQVDMNVVMTGQGTIVEVQGTAEETPFTREELEEMLNYADKGIRELIQVQQGLLGTSWRENS